MTPVVRRELYSRSHGITMLFLAFGVQLSQDYCLLFPRHNPFTNLNFLRASYPTARDHPSSTTTHHTFIYPAQLKSELNAMGLMSFQEGFRTVYSSGPGPPVV